MQTARLVYAEAVVLTSAVVSRSQAGVAIAAGPGGILMDAVLTGAVFSLLQGAFYQASSLALCCSQPSNALPTRRSAT